MPNTALQTIPVKAQVFAFLVDATRIIVSISYLCLYVLEDRRSHESVGHHESSDPDLSEHELDEGAAAFLQLRLLVARRRGGRGGLRPH